MNLSLLAVFVSVGLVAAGLIVCLRFAVKSLPPSRGTDWLFARSVSVDADSDVSDTLFKRGVLADVDSGRHQSLCFVLPD